MMDRDYAMLAEASKREREHVTEDDARRGVCCSCARCIVDRMTIAIHVPALLLACADKEKVFDHFVERVRLLDETGPSPDMDPAEAIAEARDVLTKIESVIATGIHAEVERFDTAHHPWGAYYDLRVKIGFIMGG